MRRTATRRGTPQQKEKEKKMDLSISYAPGTPPLCEQLLLKDVREDVSKLAYLGEQLYYLEHARPIIYGLAVALRKGVKMYEKQRWMSAEDWRAANKLAIAIDQIAWLFNSKLADYLHVTAAAAAVCGQLDQVFGIILPNAQTVPPELLSVKVTPCSDDRYSDPGRLPDVFLEVQNPALDCSEKQEKFQWYYYIFDNSLRLADCVINGRDMALEAYSLNSIPSLLSPLHGKSDISLPLSEICDSVYRTYLLWVVAHRAPKDTVKIIMRYLLPLPRSCQN